MSQLRVGNIASSGGTAALEISSTGAVAAKNPIAFSVSRTAGNLSGPVTVVYDFVRSNLGNAYNTSTGIFTAPITGAYFFAWFGMNNNGGTFAFELHKNGATTLTNPFATSASGTYAGNAGSSVLNLTAGDQITTFIPSGCSLYSVGNAHNGFSGFLIG